MGVCGQIPVILGVLDKEKFENHGFRRKYLEDRIKIKILFVLIFFNNNNIKTYLPFRLHNVNWQVNLCLRQFKLQYTIPGTDVRPGEHERRQAFWKDGARAWQEGAAVTCLVVLCPVDGRLLASLSWLGSTVRHYNYSNTYCSKINLYVNVCCRGSLVYDTFSCNFRTALLTYVMGTAGGIS